MHKTILITGGAGFIGSNFVPYFCEKYPEYKKSTIRTILNDMINNTISNLPLDGTCDEKIIAMLIM